MAIYRLGFLSHRSRRRRSQLPPPAVAAAAAASRSCRPSSRPPHCLAIRLQRSAPPFSRSPVINNPVWLSQLVVADEVLRDTEEPPPVLFDFFHGSSLVVVAPPVSSGHHTNMRGNDGDGGSGSKRQSHTTAEAAEECSMDVDIVPEDDGAAEVEGNDKSASASPRPAKKLRSVADIAGVPIVQPSSRARKSKAGTSKGDLGKSKRDLGKNKAPMAPSSSNKISITPTSKFMGSAFKAAASNKTVTKALVLVPSKKAIPSIGTSASASASASANIEASEEEEEDANERPGKKSSSWVWSHFTKFVKKVIIDDNTTIEESWAKCNRCKHVAKASSINGTSAFSKHLRNKHSVVKGQQLLDQTKDGIATYRYDEKISLRKFNCAIIMHEYPFRISEHEYFVDFIKSLRPTFPMKCRTTVRKEIMDIYKEEWNMLYEHFKTLSCRFSFTMDMWTSIQNKSYMCVTAHWVDDNWKMQKRIINFVHVKGNHSGIKLGEEFFRNVLLWNLDKKLLALSLDNASSNNVAVDVVIDKAKDFLLCGGKFFHIRCVNHILNLVARDGLEFIECAVGNIRQFISIVKRSPQQFEAFEKCAKECNLDTTRALSLDVATRWNSTYLMLRNAFYYKDAFGRLARIDGDRYELVTPSRADWVNVASICKCLKKFYDATLLFSGTVYPTANLFFRRFCEIKLAIDKWSGSNDIIVSNLGDSMKDKFDKYWEMANMALAVAAFLDPRCKHKGVELCLSNVYDKDKDKLELEKMEFKNVINELFVAYSSSMPSCPSMAFTPKEHDLGEKSSDCLLDDEDDNEIKFDELYESTSNEKKSELEVYMSEARHETSINDDTFDILSWWKGQTTNFPILSRLARDVLSIQVSTVASESAFSAGGRVIDPFRTRLRPTIVEALVCTKDWMLASRKDSARSNVETLSDLFNNLESDEDEEIEVEDT